MFLNKNLRMTIKLKHFIWLIMILGIMTPFISHAVVVQMFFLLIPFGIILIVSLPIFIFNILKYKKNVRKQQSTLILCLLPIFLISQIVSTFTVDKIQRFRTNQIIEKIREKKMTINSSPIKNFGIEYYTLRGTDFIVQYNRGFLVTEKYYDEEKEWKSYGWND